MNDKLDFFIYSKYERYSAQYIISIEQINDLCTDLIVDKNQYTNDQLNIMLDHKIKKECYYNLLTTLIIDFNTKLKHNISLIQQNTDISYANYLKSKFRITDDFMKINVNNWNYKPNKIKIKIKLKANIKIRKTIYYVKELLSDLLKISSQKKFKYKSEIIKLVHQYIFDNQLQNIKTNMIIDCDQNLLQILLPLQSSDENYTYFNLPKYLTHMIISEK